jgi:hypothetical protein
VTLDAAAIDTLTAQPNAVATLSIRDAELADMLAGAGLEPRLAGAAPALRLAAVTRPARTRLTP